MVQTKPVHVTITKQYTWSTGTKQKPNILQKLVSWTESVTNYYRTFEGSTGFPKDVNISANQVRSQNVSRRQMYSMQQSLLRSWPVFAASQEIPHISRRQTVFTGSRKHGSPQITRKKSDIRYIQTRWATFQPEQTGNDNELWITWENNISAEQRYQLHWCNLSVTSVCHLL
jgi:hypothetical protein